MGTPSCIYPGISSRCRSFLPSLIAERSLAQNIWGLSYLLVAVFIEYLSSVETLAALATALVLPEIELILRYLQSQSKFQISFFKRHTLATHQGVLQ